LNPPSTPSRLIFNHSLSSFRHHHLHLRHHHSPPTQPNRPVTSPSPLLRDVGSTVDNPVPHARTQPASPLPFSKGCGRLIVVRRRNGGRRNMRGTQVGGPHSTSRKRATTFVMARFFPSLFDPTNELNTKKTPGTMTTGIPATTTTRTPGRTRTRMPATTTTRTPGRTTTRMPATTTTRTPGRTTARTRWIPPKPAPPAHMHGQRILEPGNSSRAG
jgi:hypothetical protein